MTPLNNKEGKTMTTKYLGSWSANNGSSYNTGYKFGNLKDARKTMRAICKGNVQIGNTGHWHVVSVNDLDNDVASGTIRR
jgi:hypothetical protein